MKALAILVKNPIKGLVKTRLAATIGDDNAVAVYNDLLRHTKNVAKQFDSVFVFHAPEIKAEYSWEFAVNELQSQGDLGEKMLHVFQTLFQQGYSDVVLIGSDCFDITATIINQAFSALDSNNVVFGPAVDGGYYLLGLKNNAPKALFDDIPWSTHDVLSSSVKVVKQHNLKCVLLEELNDVDEYDDLPQRYQKQFSKK